MPAPLAQLFNAILDRPALVRAPIGIYRHGFGFLLGTRFCLLQHTGRRSGQDRYVVLEVVERPRPDTLRVVSGLGESSQWLRNLRADPRCRVSTGVDDLTPATARILEPDERTACFEAYAAAHPRTAAFLLDALDRRLSPGERREDRFPVVDLQLVRTPRPVGRTMRKRIRGLTPW